MGEKIIQIQLPVSQEVLTNARFDKRSYYKFLTTLCCDSENICDSENRVNYGSFNGEIAEKLYKIVEKACMNHAQIRVMERSINQKITPDDSAKQTEFLGYFFLK